MTGDAGDWEARLDAEAGQRAYRWALDAADGWHRDPDGDLLSLADVSLGRAKRWQLFVELFLPAARAAAAGLPAEAGFLWTAPAWGIPRAKRAAGALLNAAAALRPGRRGDWLFFSYPSLEPIVERALDRGVGLTFTELPRKPLLKRLAGRARFWLPGGHARFSRAETGALETMTSRWSARRNDPALAALLTFEGKPLADAIVPRLDAFMARGLRPLADTAVQLSRRWQRRPPSLVVVPFPGPPMPQLMQQLARARGVPSALVLHGLPFSYAFPLEHPDTSHFIVWGPAQEPLYRAAGLPSSVRVIAAGNPYFDRYAGARAERRGPIKRALLLTHPVVLTTGLSSRRDPERYARELAARMDRVADLEPTLKLHPSESLEEYRSAVGASRIRLVKDEPLAECLARTDLVAGSFSTVLLEALLMGLPVISVNLTRDPFPPPFDGSWGIPHARSAEELGRLLESAVGDPEGFRAAQGEAARRVIAGFAGRLDGRSADAVAAALEDAAAGR